MKKIVSKEEFQDLQNELEESESKNEELQDQISEILDENENLDEQLKFFKESDAEHADSTTQGSQESIESFINTKNLEMKYEDVKYEYSNAAKLVSVIYYGELEALMIESLILKNTRAYEEDKKALEDLMKRLSEIVLQRFGEGYAVELRLESITDLAPLINIVDAEYYIDNFDLYTDLLLEEGS